MIDCVLLHPEHRTRIYQALGKSVAAIETPIWSAMLAGALRAKGHEVVVVDMAASDLSVEHTARTINGLRPRLTVAVVYAHQPSASTHNMTVAGEVLRQVDGPTMMVGGHPSALPERTLREEGCTYVAVGEALDTIDLLLRGRFPEDVPGLVYWSGDRILSTPSGPLIKDLEATFPTLAWDLVPPTRYRAYNWMAWGYPARQPYAALYGSLGCWANCDFCAVQSPFYAGQQLAGKTANVRRVFSPAWIGQQLEHLVNTYGVFHVRLADEMFLSGPRWVHAICDEILRRQLHLNLYVYARADTCQERALLKKMKRAGFNWVCIGFESASSAVRASVGKRYSDDLATQAAAALDEAGIHLLANYIFGLPTDTRESMEETYQQAVALNAPFVNFYCAVPYPGSPWFTQAVRERWDLPSRWEDYAQHAKGFHPLSTKDMTSAEVVAFRDQHLKEYVSRPTYQAAVRQRFGDVALADVQAMAARPLLERVGR